MVATLAHNTALNSPASHWAVMRKHAKTFSWAARVLPAEIRQDTSVLYTFARFADDLADEDAMGNQAERAGQLTRLQAQLEGREPMCAPLDELMAVMLRRGLPVAPLQCFLKTLLQDLHGFWVEDEWALFRYAYGVAGCVGLTMRPLLGGPPAADRAAAALGMAMQLTNIARDVAQDWRQGRLYIPATWLSATGSARRDHSGPVEEFVSRQAVLALIEQAEVLYDEGLRGVSDLSPACRQAIRLAAILYREIGRKIARMPEPQYWRTRVVVNKFEKLKLTVMSSVAPGFCTARPLQSPQPPYTGSIPMRSAAEIYASLAGMPGFGPAR